MIAAQTTLTMGVSGADKVTDRVAMLRIGNAVVALIRVRTLRGRSAKGDPFKPYSTRRIWIPLNKGAGARLAPKGGKLSRTRKSMRYDGGWAEYKQRSAMQGQLPQGGAASGPTAAVNLTLSGQMLRSIRPAQADDRSVVVQVGDGAADYAEGVQQARPFMGVAPDEMPKLQRIAEAAVADWIKRAGVTVST